MERACWSNGHDLSLSETAVLLEMRDVTKSFGATRALDGVSLGVDSGEVRALIGENGAGKSTLMKILSGAHRPDSGSMSLAGEPYAPRGPRDARARGVAMIYQELALAPDLTVEANIMLGQERVRAGLIRRREHRKLVSEALALLEHPDIRPEAKVGDLGVGAQQLVEVARALVSSARVIVFDEPTSSLSEHDAERLFAIVERLRGRGLAIIYISHFLEEARRVAQTYTVLRDGKAVAAGRLAETDLKSIIASMVGRNLDELFPRVPHTPGEPILEIDQLRVRKTARPVSLVLQARRNPGHRRVDRRGPDHSGALDLRARPGRRGPDTGPPIHRRLRSAQNTHRPRGRVRERRPQDRRAGPLAIDRRQHDLFRTQTARALGLAQAQAAARRGRPLDRAAANQLRPAPARSRRTFPVATSKKWHWHGCSINGPTSCSWTSRPAASTSAPRPRSIA